MNEIECRVTKLVLQVILRDWQNPRCEFDSSQSGVLSTYSSAESEIPILVLAERTSCKYSHLTLRRPFIFVIILEICISFFRQTYYENITKKNREFIDEIVEDSFGPKAVIHGIETYDLKSPLQTTPFERGQWNIKSRRTGLIGKKIGVYPMWTNTGERVVTTLIQACDPHQLLKSVDLSFLPYLSL